jgi:hypothetical protein
VTDLHHHGDAGPGPGLVDLAVNVPAGAPPPWCRRVPHEALDASAGCPDAEAAGRSPLAGRSSSTRRPGDTFPGRSPDHRRVAVRDPGTSRSFASGLAEILSPAPVPEEIR